MRHSKTTQPHAIKYKTVMMNDFGTVTIFLEELMHELPKYDMHIALNKTFQMYAGNKSDVKWIIAGSTEIKKKKNFKYLG